MNYSFNKLQERVFDIKIKFMFNKGMLKRELTRLKQYISKSDYYKGNKKRAYKFINSVLKE